ncbi:metallophosphoesterase [Psychromonas ossibalaenae]|uniref:metallophosphoesterase n=1 Tax=Psychromonas ossibalaenae TaxID=444922 RepID=UPI0003631E5A|nr:metallophosphoesterase [Psychromonas ossibalaenae]
MNSLAAHNYYEANRNGRDFFVGDIHGKHSLLMLALEQINFDFSVDRLFSVGDVIDRGEDSFYCLLLANKNWFIPVIGNHEQFLREIDDNNMYKKFSWYENGGGWWENLAVQEKLLAKNIIAKNFCLTLSVDTAGGKVGVVHAQYPLDKWPMHADDVNKDNLFKLLWSRDYLRNGHTHSTAGIDFIVSGHTPISKARLEKQLLFIDSGCGHLPNEKRPTPHLTICEFQKKHIDVYAVAEQHFELSKIDI